MRTGIDRVPPTEGDLSMKTISQRLVPLLAAALLFSALALVAPGCGDTPAPGSIVIPEQVLKKLQDRPKTIEIPKNGIRSVVRPGRR
jgi:hypothetical protein